MRALQSHQGLFCYILSHAIGADKTGKDTNQGQTLQDRQGILWKILLVAIGADWTKRTPRNNGTSVTRPWSTKMKLTRFCGPLATEWDERVEMERSLWLERRPKSNELQLKQTEEWKIHNDRIFTMFTKKKQKGRDSNNNIETWPTEPPADEPGNPPVSSTAKPSCTSHTASLTVPFLLVKAALKNDQTRDSYTSPRPKTRALCPQTVRINL